MSKKTRTILFFLFAFLFVATIPFLIAYTQGYRLDWEHRRFVQTGGMDFSVRPLGVRVFVDGKFRQETNFFFRDATMRNILPRDYEVRMERDAYATWHKTVSVLESFVTKFPDVRLFPENPERTTLDSSLSQLYASPNGRYALGLSRQTELPSIELFSFASAEPTSSTILSLRANEQLLRAGFNANSTVAWFVTEFQGTQSLNTVSVQQPTEVVNWDSLTIPLGRGILTQSHIAPTASATSIFIAPPNTTGQTYTVYSLIAGQNAPIEVGQNISALSSVGSSLILLDESGVLMSRDMPSGGITVLSTDAQDALTGATPQLFVQENGAAVAILSEGELWVWQRGHQLARFAQNVSGVSFALSGVSLAYWGNDELSVLWLETIFGPPARIRGEHEVIVRAPNIYDAIWLEDRSAHIAAATPTHFIVAELDGRDHRNTISYNIENVFSFFSPLNQRLHALPGDGTITSFGIE